MDPHIRPRHEALGLHRPHVRRPEDVDPHRGLVPPQVVLGHALEEPSVVQAQAGEVEREPRLRMRGACARVRSGRGERVGLVSQRQREG